MKTNVTQIIVLVVFVIFLIVGVFLFSMSGSSSQGTSNVTLDVWGTIHEEDVSRIIQAVNGVKAGTLNMSYREIKESDFEQTLIEALADGTGPDVAIIPNSILLKNQKKFLLIGTNYISLRDYKDTFTEGAEVFLASEGTYALPIVADPMVMYWNRDILTAKGIARPPQTWEEVLSLAEAITEKREDKSIIRSAVALGDYTNVLFSKDILTTLVVQSGGKLVIRNSADAAVNMLNSNEGFEVNPLTNALNFFTQFSDPLKPIYSWNRSLPDSATAFLNGDLALFFAPASVAQTLRTKNPNLNFDIAPIPQPKGSQSKSTSGVIYGMSILATSKNPQQAFSTMMILASSDVASLFATSMGLPPVRRDLLSIIPGDAFGGVFWQSSLWTKAWLDPNPKMTDGIFKSAVDGIITGKFKPDDASRLISKQVTELLK